MSLKKMKYKNFTWPNNPAEYNVSHDKRIISHSYPDLNKSEQEELGTNSRIVTGSGVFFGKNAYKDYLTLHNVFIQKTPGLLVHPIWPSFHANFTKLVTKEEPLPNYVAYEFEFIEHAVINTVTKIIPPPKPAKPPTPPVRTYTVKKGDNLWNISKKYYGTGTKWPTIANANKKIIKNPNLIYPGQVLVIP